MQNLDKIANFSTVEMCCFPNSEDEAEELVVFELVVPKGAKVPPSRQQVEVAKLVVQPASVTSTVARPASILLQANDTAQATAWCVTVALAVPQSQLLSVY